jgi:hypothetical protein
LFQVASTFSFSKGKGDDDKKKNLPLSELKPKELEKLGQKAVADGASPLDLQKAFAKAQVSVWVCVRERGKKRKTGERERYIVS